MEDQDRTPEEEPEVEGHRKEEGLLEDGMLARDDDEVEAHALRDEPSDQVWAKDEPSDEPY